VRVGLIDLLATLRLLGSRILFAAASLASEAAIVRHFGANEVAGTLLILMATSSFVVSIVASNLGATVIPYALRQVLKGSSEIGEIFQSVARLNRGKYFALSIAVLFFVSLWLFFETKSSAEFIFVSALTQLVFCIYGGKVALFTAQRYAEKKYASPQIVRLITPCIILVACFTVVVSPEWVLILASIGSVVEYLVIRGPRQQKSNGWSPNLTSEIANVSSRGYFLAFGSVVVALLPLIGAYLLASRAPESSSVFVLGSRIPAFALAFLGSVLGVTILVDFAHRNAEKSTADMTSYFDWAVKLSGFAAIGVAVLIWSAYLIASQAAVPVLAKLLDVSQEISTQLIYVCATLMLQIPFALVSIVVGRIFCAIEQPQLLTHAALGAAATFFGLLVFLGESNFSLRSLCLSLVGSQVFTAGFLVFEYLRRKRNGALH
jgi:hypothetical protein